jgi:hypothetical protein
MLEKNRTRHFTTMAKAFSPLGCNSTCYQYTLGPVLRFDLSTRGRFLYLTEARRSLAHASRPFPFPVPLSLSLWPTFQSLDMDSAGPSSSAATAATGSPPAPPPLLRLPRFTLGFGNPSPCTVANTSVDDLVAQLLRVAYEGDRTKVKREFSRRRNFCSTPDPGQA